MNKKEVTKLLFEGDVKSLKAEAIRRGYITGAIIDYNIKDEETSVLGNGAYQIYYEDDEPLLIKWDGSQFDVLFSERGWSKLINSHKKNK